ncbi:hypothetical protein COB64_00560 [Candidatus Wolfebacteria bacterium]|nr:MAG: hypothetical protein COB64_00560 [Candidatus Wolfebacteria bacterium]
MKYIKKNWNKFSNTYGGSQIYFNSVSHHIELIREYKKYFSKYIKKDSVVLDLGAGRLFYKNFLKNYTDNYFSLDFKKTHKDLDYIGTTSRTNLENERFDIVFSSQVFEHIPDPLESFHEINRILKKGGIAIISVPFLMYIHNEPYDYFRYTRYSLKKFSDENNFEILVLKEVGGFFGFLGSVGAIFSMGLFWNIPILKWVVYGLNFIIQYILLFLDRISRNKKVFPSNYLLIIKKE